MKKTFIFLAVVFGMMYACNYGDKQNTASASQLAPESADIKRLKYQKSSTDSLFAQNQDKIEVLVKLADKPDLILFKDTILPDDTETSFNILRDSSKNITIILESPYSESGDWFLTLTHYFDKNGKTYAFERQTNFFNSGCTEGVAYETRTEFYDNNLKSIHKDYKLIDEKGKDLKKDSCYFLYDYDYKVSPNLEKYLKSNGIKNNNK